MRGNKAWSHFCEYLRQSNRYCHLVKFFKENGLWTDSHTRVHTRARDIQPDEVEEAVPSDNPDNYAPREGREEVESEWTIERCTCHSQTEIERMQQQRFQEYIEEHRRLRENEMMRVILGRERSDSNVSSNS